MTVFTNNGKTTLIFTIQRAPDPSTEDWKKPLLCVSWLVRDYMGNASTGPTRLLVI